MGCSLKKKKKNSSCEMTVIQEPDDNQSVLHSCCVQLQVRYLLEPRRVCEISSLSAMVQYQKATA